MVHGYDNGPIEQLEQAAAAVPPDIALARTAIGDVGELLHHVDSKERVYLIQRTTELTDQITEALVGDDNTDEAVVDEFCAYNNTYSAIASILGIQAVEQPVPTQTAGKSMTGGKR